MFNVIVKDGKTQNLATNMLAMNGDLEPTRPGISTPFLDDGEYDAAGFEFVVQMDDSYKVWVMAEDSHVALKNGWPIRSTLYFFKSNLEDPKIKCHHVKQANPSKNE